jgi:hypothetical protein
MSLPPHRIVYSPVIAPPAVLSVSSSSCGHIGPQAALILQAKKAYALPRGMICVLSV